MPYCERCKEVVNGIKIRDGFIGWKTRRYIIAIICEKCYAYILGGIRVDKDKFYNAKKKSELFKE